MGLPERGMGRVFVRARGKWEGFFYERRSP